MIQLNGIPSKIFLFTVFFLLLYAANAYSVELRWAKGFTVEERDGITLIDVRRPWAGSTAEFHYLLKKQGQPTPPGYEDRLVVEVPVRRVVVLSSTVLGYLDKLGLIDRVVGFSEPLRAYSSVVRRAAVDGKIATVGMGSSLRVEEILSLNPDLVFTFATGSFRDAHPKLLEAGLGVGMVAEYLEEHPLGRTEWIKFFGLLFGCEQQAEEVFRQIERRYLELAAYTAKITKKRPTVITGAPFNGQWYVAGGNSFVGRLLADAGADYLWGETTYSGSRPVDVEMVFARGLDADFWLNPGVWKSVAQGRATDPRFLQFKALREGRLFNNNRRLSESGANDYWESGVIAPDRLLEDLVSIFHPQLLPEHQLYYYVRLPEEL